MIWFENCNILFIQSCFLVYFIRNVCVMPFNIFHVMEASAILFPYWSVCFLLSISFCLIISPDIRWWVLLACCCLSFCQRLFFSFAYFYFFRFSRRVCFFVQYSLSFYCSYIFFPFFHLSSHLCISLFSQDEVKEVRFLMGRIK